MTDNKTTSDKMVGAKAAGQGASAPLPEDEALGLAAYLDGRLDEEEAARLEARMAREAALLDEVLALRQGLADALEALPAPLSARIVARAQALQPPPRRVGAVVRDEPSRLGGLLALWLRPALPAAFAVLAVLLASAGAFELGRYQAAQLEASEISEAEADVPVDLLLGELL